MSEALVCTGDHKCSYCKGLNPSNPKQLYGGCMELSLRQKIAELEAENARLRESRDYWKGLLAPVGDGVTDDTERLQMLVDDPYSGRTMTNNTEAPERIGLALPIEPYTETFEDPNDGDVEYIRADIARWHGFKEQEARIAELEADYAKLYLAARNNNFDPMEHPEP